MGSHLNHEKNPTDEIYLESAHGFLNIIAPIMVQAVLYPAWTIEKASSLTLLSSLSLLGSSPLELPVL